MTMEMIAMIVAGATIAIGSIGYFAFMGLLL